MSKEFFRNVLLPIDGSASSIMAQETAATIAKKTHAAITVLHIVPIGTYYEEMYTTYRIPTRVTDEIISAFEQKGERIISDAKAFFDEEGVPIKAEILRGNYPSDTILEYLKYGYDFIIIGAHGENEKDPYALGAVAKLIIAHSKHPILVTKKVSSLSNILACIDGSERSTRALDFAVNLAEKMGSKLTLLNVQEDLLHTVAPETTTELGEHLLSKSLDAIGKSGLKIEKKLEIGDASDKIVDVAEEGKYDLIVLGSRGLGFFRKTLFGSISDDVAHKAKCSVLIVP